MTNFDPSNSIELLELSRRSFNALSDNGFLTVGQLIKITPDQLHDIRNLGKKSIEEIWGRIQMMQNSTEDSTDRIPVAPRMHQMMFFLMRTVSCVKISRLISLSL